MCPSVISEEKKDTYAQVSVGLNLTLAEATKWQHARYLCRNVFILSRWDESNPNPAFCLPFICLIRFQHEDVCQGGLWVIILWLEFNSCGPSIAIILFLFKKGLFLYTFVYVFI